MTPWRTLGVLFTGATLLGFFLREFAESPRFIEVIGTALLLGGSIAGMIWAIACTSHLDREGGIQ